MSLKRILCFILILFSLHGLSTAQEVEASLSFLVDTTAVGKPIGLRVAIAHPENMPVIFPKKKKDFSPFEYVSQKAVPTRTANGMSFDTAIYQLRTFELDEFQSINLPVGYIQQGDTFSVATGEDSVKLNYRYQEGVSTAEFKAVPFPIEMKDPPNYTLIILFGLAGIVLMIGVYFVIKEPVMKRLKLRRNKKQLEEALFKLRSVSEIQDSEKQIEIINELWKSYLDPNKELKLTALTTPELEEELQGIHHLQEEHRFPLMKASALYDKAVYAGVPINNEDVNDLMVDLLPVFEAEYVRRREEITQDK